MSRRSTSAIRHARTAPRPRGGILRTALTGVLSLCVATGALVGIGAVSAAAADPCTPPTNPVACENSLEGNDPDDWDVPGKGDHTVRGFATDISTNVGGTVTFKVDAEAAYSLKIFRLGYYGGKGARFITERPVTVRNENDNCLQNPDLALFDCGSWGVAATWPVPATAVSGVYIAKIERNDGQGASHIPFIVRNDASTSDILFQTSDTTWHAYNPFGLGDFYSGGGNNGRAYAVSYNRPVPTHGDNTLFAYEYSQIRFMEAQGYDVSYFSGIDSDRYGDLIKNHKIFTTAGHDEYWSGAQRANVKAARDANVNLAFFAGNDMYWRIRWQDAISPDGTPYRTMVCYKETWADQKLDQTSGEWTGTWRDPRFTTAPNGALPENELVGTAYMANYTDLAMEVPAADGKLRLWRNTSVANLAAGTKATLAPHTIGYESNEDLDNGFRPAGTIRLSDTTGPTPEYLRDYGKVVTPGTTRHNMTLYKAPSGALVFSAGTIQWSWGLDTEHDGPVEPVDVRMRQATVNLFADMGAQPKTLQSDLVLAAKTSDTTAPTSAITSPAAGATLTGGTPVTITGTAADVGGRVGGIEVSTDGGARWHPATTGRDSWTYAWTPSGTGPATIAVRATDDSGNIQSAPTTRVVTTTCPCTLFPGATPQNQSVSDTAAYELGVRWRPQVDGWVSGITFFKGEGNAGTHTGSLWNAAGERIATGTFVNETATGWQTMKFGAGIRVTAGENYTASYYAPSGRYAADVDYFFNKDTSVPPLFAPRATDTAGNGVFAVGASAYPTGTNNETNYYVSPVFDTVEPPDTIPPTLVSTTPINGASSVKLSVAPTATFDEPIKAGTTLFRLSSAAGQVAGTTTFDTARRVATFTPSAPLAAGTTYTISVTGSTDDSNNPLPAYTSTFRTAQSSVPGECPCSLWTDSDEPTIPASDDTGAVNLGVRFTPAENGYVSGIRFYKGVGNSGTHVGTLYRDNGEEIATATFANESSTGWQEVRFAQRVEVTAGTTYVAAYNAPNGRYAVSNGGLNTAVSSPPLSAPANGNGDTNGLYRYGVKAAPVTATGTNYWVDVVFELPPDTTPPAVTATSPAANGKNALLSTKPVATFGERVSNVQATLRRGSTTLPATLALDSTGRKATLTPGAALEAGTTYTVTVTAATDRAGNQLAAPFSWSFTTSGAEVCPCTLFPSDYTPAVTASDDTAALELGVRFVPSTNGFVTGMRFYKGAGNAGTHTGTLWTADGGLITTATFQNETATGWQNVTFGSPVAVTAGTAYVVSYSAPVGRYSADAGLFDTPWANGPLTAPAPAGSVGNGVYGTTLRAFPTRSFNATSYGVDVTFTAAQTNDETPPDLVSTNPVAGATSVPVNQAFTARFNEAMAGTTSGTITLANGTVVPSTTAVGSDGTVTVTPSAALAYNTPHTIRITGGDLAGNALPSPVTWSVTTARAPSTTAPYSLWSDEAAPAVPAVDDTDAIEVGVKFSPTSNGYVTGIRFYKGATNTGTHVGTLWNAAGEEQARATFQGESAAGWQEVTFEQPVQVTAGTTYVASYNAPRGGYGYTAAGLATGVARGPLVAPAGSAAAPNGVYRYGTRAFPSQGTDANYWVDVVFDTAPPADTTPPTVTTRVPAAAATNVSPNTAAAATFSEAMSPATVGLTLRNTATSANVAGTATYDATTRTVTFLPGARLADSTGFTARVTGSDAAGNAMAAGEWAFTTGDGTAPTVTAVTPAQGATNVAATTQPAATFSEPVGTGTLTFTLADGATAIAGTTTYNATTRVATFAPAAALPQGRTLTATVTASDAAGNPMAAPRTWTFTTADTTPPAVTGVAATGSGTTATVTWTTNEAATSRVIYGTTATNLNLTANGPAGTRTSHSVALSALAPNTRYYYRVVSADVANNSTTSPATTAAAAQYAPAVTPFVQNTASGFGSGTQSSTYLSPRTGGGVQLSPSGGAQEFTGTTVPTSWTSTSLATGSSVTVGNGVATVSGRFFRSTGTFSAGRELDAIATLRPVNNQWLGFTSGDYTSILNRWAAFRTTATGGLVAETRTSALSSGLTTTTLATNLTGTSRRYEIDWTSTQVIYRVDGNVVATHNVGTTTAMYVAARDVTQDTNTIVLDSVWLTPYATSGVFTSNVVDAGASVNWGNLTVAATIPANTGVTYDVRTGPGATAGGTGWSAWTRVAAGADIPLANRYLQYRANLTATTAGARNSTPALTSVTLPFTIP